MAGKLNREEDNNQRAIVDWLAIHEKQGRLFGFHIPNGGARSKLEAAILKGLGVRAGVLDLLVIWRAGFGFLEVKAKAGRLEQSQKDFIAVLDCFGIPWAIVRDVVDADRVLREWGAIV